MCVYILYHHIGSMFPLYADSSLLLRLGQIYVALLAQFSPTPLIALQTANAQFGPSPSPPLSRYIPRGVEEKKKFSQSARNHPPPPHLPSVHANYFHSHFNSLPSPGLLGRTSLGNNESAGPEIYIHSNPPHQSNFVLSSIGVIGHRHLLL